MARERAWTSTGQTERIDAPGGIDRVPEFDPRAGDHLWTVVTMYQVDPAKWSDPDHLPILDHESLLTVAGPGCYYCEQRYSPQLASRRCKGDA